MSVFESTKRMSPKEQIAFDLGYEKAKSEIAKCKDCKFWTVSEGTGNNWGKCTRLLDRYTEDSESNFDADTYWSDYCSLGERKG